jgi:hypothetical protein
MSTCNLTCHGQGYRWFYWEPVTGAVPEKDWEGKSLILSDTLPDFLLIFNSFRFPIKMPKFWVEGHTRDYPGVPFLSRDRYP